MKGCTLKFRVHYIKNHILWNLMVYMVRILENQEQRNLEFSSLWQMSKSYFSLAGMHYWYYHAVYMRTQFVSVSYLASFYNSNTKRLNHNHRTWILLCSESYSDVIISPDHEAQFLVPSIIIYSCMQKHLVIFHKYKHLHARTYSSLLKPA